MEKKWKYELKISTMGVNYGCSYNIYVLALLTLSKRKCDFVFPSKNLSFWFHSGSEKISVHVFPRKRKYAFVFPSKKIHFGFVSASEKLYAVVVRSKGKCVFVFQVK